KPVIVADEKKGTLYVGWTRWTLTASPLVISQSTDGGATWSGPVEVERVPGLPRDDNGANEGFSGAVAPDGTLYAVWAEGTHIVLTSSKDEGKTFAAARDVIETAPLMYAVQGFSRGNGFPNIAAGPDGALYVAWSDYRNGDVDVFLSRSKDRGVTWSAAQRVNDDAVHDGSDQFYQWLSVDPKDGSVNLIFYDRREDANNSKTLVTLARSEGGGAPFRNYRWAEKPFVARDEFMGDYSGIAAYGGRVYGVWTEAATAQSEKPEERKPKTLVNVGIADFRKEP
ncbi:MAG: exo-alpha-sialidase, partial [Acidobacteriales bacterium]|nr:exo-alpha-sialidase [Terriglobales bacterium]